MAEVVTMHWGLIRTVSAWAAALCLASALLQGQMKAPGEHHPGVDHRDDGFAYCVLKFSSDRKERDGTGWTTDYPMAGRNFGIRIGELTTVRSTEAQWIVDVGEPELFACPMVFASDVGTMALTDAEAANLRAYLEKGGLVWADDFWGTESWTQWLRELGKFVPRGTQVLTPAPGHAIHHTWLNTSETLQVSHVGIWTSTGEVSERGEDSPQTQLQVAVDADGRVLVVMTHNTDIQDTWEREGTNPYYFQEFAPRGYAQGINVVLYAMTH